jgi:uncharacterized phage-associated protein
MQKLKALKLVFFADRYHLRRFGRPVTGDEYLAMNFGPVASGTKDLAEMSDFLGEDERNYAIKFIEPFNHLEYRSLASVESRIFSESDMLALTWAWEKFGLRERFDLAEYTHHYPEWKRHEPALTAKVETRAPMNYRDFLEDPEPGYDPCHPLAPEEREALAAGIDERACFERLWQ